MPPPSLLIFLCHRDHATLTTVAGHLGDRNPKEDEEEEPEQENDMKDDERQELQRQMFQIGVE